MRCTTVFFPALMASLASTVSATVYLGTRTGVDGSQQKVAWTNGTPDSCSGFTNICPADQNPCGRDFYVDGNNGPFTFEGCGGSNFHLERNHKFNSNCKYDPKTLNCGGGSKIKQEWNCA